MPRLSNATVDNRVVQLISLSPGQDDLVIVPLPHIDEATEYFLRGAVDSFRPCRHGGLVRFLAQGSPHTYRVNWVSYKSEYTPPWVSNSACVPRCTIAPSTTTRI